MFTVYLFDREVGTLERARRGIRFTYTSEAVQDDAMPALSTSLPKRAESFTNRHAGPYFQNLLPEQSYRRLVGGATPLDPSDSLGLLGAIGGECPGAVSIWPEGHNPPERHDYELLTDSALEALFSMREPGRFGAAVARGRLSLPGVQEKIALLRERTGEWKLPLNGAVTSHILKRPAMEFPGLLANELFCMTLARASGLNVSAVAIAAPGIDVLSVERFDRVASGATQSRPRLRVHQEDFCQALGVEPERKYQRDGGPGLSQCAAFVRNNSSLPARDIPALVGWVGFNYLIGNEDAHAKNLAFLFTDDGLRLSPHYDLVCTTVYPNLERSMAMKLGSAWDIREVQRADWKTFANQTRQSWDLVRSDLLNLADSVAAALTETHGQCSRMLQDDETYSRVGDGILERIERLRRELTHTT
jgi:serine/threonine-protein kinase HipA